MYAQDNNSLPVWIILSLAYHHISINSQPFLVGIVSSTTPMAGGVDGLPSLSRRMMSAGSGTITVSVGGAPSHHLPWHAGQPQSMPIPPSRNYTGRRPRPMPCPAPCSVGCWCSKLHSQLLDHLGEQYIACTHCLPEGAMWPSSILNWGALTWTSVSWLLTWQTQVKGERPCVRSSKSW